MTKKLPDLHKTTDVTLKRGIGAAAEETSKKKLPGKTKPPTLTLKRGKNESLDGVASGNIRIERKPKPPQTGQFSSKTAKKPSVEA